MSLDVSSTAPLKHVNGLVTTRDQVTLSDTAKVGHGHLHRPAWYVVKWNATAGGGPLIPKERPVVDVDLPSG